LGLFFIVTVTLISGTRAVALVLLLNMLMIWIITLKNAKVLFFAVICSPFVLGAAVYIGLIRNDEFYLSNSVELFTGTLLYGNEFSDIRDFGWILTGWDGHYRQGITYVAALFSFIPSDIFTWRRENGMVWQLTGPLGLMDQGHTGLRPGPFGESFINFGYLGVISMGLFLGTLSTLIDNGLSRIKSSVQSRLAYTCAGFTIFGLFAMFSNTSGFFAFYASIIVFATILTIANSTKRI
jgi:oligosaccharide repeat unit polymerase